jgi:hypothetical protein
MVGKTILLLLVSAVVAVGWIRHEDRIREQDRLAVVASSIVGHKVGVGCPSFFAKLVNVSGEAGHVGFDERGRPADHTDLSPDTCDALRRVDRIGLSCLDSGTCGDQQFRVGWAIHTLAHESFHLRGVAQESVAECYAMQTTADAALRLGLTPARAAQLQAWIWKKGYSEEPDEYRTPKCGNGGPYDLHPESTVWP